LVGEDGGHAGQGQGRPRVDRGDARGGVGAAHDEAVEHAGHRVVAGVDRPPPHLLPRVGPRRALADDPVGHRGQTSQPPSTVTDWPVMLAESSEARNTTALAMSRAVVTRRSAISSTYSWCTCSGVHPRLAAFSRHSRSIRGPATMPGCSALT